MALIKFTRTPNDLSTDRGSASGTLADALDVASGLFGGLLGNAEYLAAQTEAAVQQARQAAQEATYVTKEKFDQTVVGACPHCGASIAANAKFCGECGQPIKRVKFYTECSAQYGRWPKILPGVRGEVGLATPKNRLWMTKVLLSCDEN